MELIVKIGADQAGLNKIVQDMSAKFKSMNTSIGGGMLPNAAAMQKYGSIMQKGADPSGGLHQFTSDLSKVSPALGHFVETLSSFAGPLTLLGGALGVAGIAVKTFTDKMSEASAVARESRITGLSDSMVKNIKHAGEASGIGGDEAMTAFKRMLGKAGEALAGKKESSELFKQLGIDPNGMTSDQLITSAKSSFENMKDPAKRAMLSKELFGKGGYDTTEMLSKLHTETSGSENIDIEQLAGARKGWKTWLANFNKNVDRELTEAAALLVYKRGRVADGAGESKVMTADPEEDLKAQKEREKEDKERAKKRAETYKDIQTFWDKRNEDLAKDTEDRKKSQMEMERIKPFEADSMSKSGLFSGSSLLFNPMTNISQQQLEVLRQIAAKIGNSTFIQ
jgi:hypothetical protein